MWERLDYIFRHWGRDKIYAILQRTFSNEFSLTKMYVFFIKISLKFVPNNIPALTQIMDWRWSGYKPLSDIYISYFICLQTILHIGLKYTLFATYTITLITQRPIPSRCTAACKHVHQVRAIRHVLAGNTLAFIDIWIRIIDPNKPDCSNINVLITVFNPGLLYFRELWELLYSQNTPCLFDNIYHFKELNLWISYKIFTRTNSVYSRQCSRLNVE